MPPLYEASQPGGSSLETSDRLMDRLPGPEGEDQTGAGPGGEGLLATEGGHEEDSVWKAAQAEENCHIIVTE